MARIARRQSPGNETSLAYPHRPNARAGSPPTIIEHNYTLILARAGSAPRGDSPPHGADYDKRNRL
ncbi:MAG: hypothetical protein ACLUSP_02390 [Christensenellales bacterium]